MLCSFGISTEASAAVLLLCPGAHAQARYIVYGVCVCVCKLLQLKVSVDIVSNLWTH